MPAPFTPLWINGQPRPSSTNETFEVRNPYTHELVGTAASASSQDCKDAVDAAAKAFVTWENTPIPQRREVLLKAADALASDKFKKAVIDAGKQETATIDLWVNANWAATVQALRTAAGFVNELKGETFVSGAVPGAQVFVQRRAIGVIFSIAPWNVPLNLSVRAVATPLICGNTVVLKSSEFSPRSQAIVAEIFQEAGLPAGVLNFINMSRESAPGLTAEIIANPHVRKINFTGSDRVGKIIAAEAAKYLKPCVFELGGKAPAVVLNDADIDEAARAISFGAMLHSGQVCMSTERVIVQKGAAQALKDTVASYCKTLKAGDPTTDSTAKLGALFTEGSAENVIKLVKEAKEAGADVFLGDFKREGSVVQPHLISGVKPGMRAWDQESFGPVIVFAEVDTADEAVELANSSEYTLVSSVWTKDIYTAFDVAARIRAGYSNINGTTMHVEPLASHMGLGGATGYGRFDIDAFTHKRTVVLHPAHRKYPLVG
ncbi:hypothetical protein PLICRDRAFT_173167 [Plicaturopsis crispa FD-325 SS-3]|nr:hypothetical protein PLICRDRAFT_173167 [Plicaturopsis crispa FD-325 SS-3]